MEEEGVEDEDGHDDAAAAAAVVAARRRRRYRVASRRWRREPAGQGRSGPVPVPWTVVLVFAAVRELL